MSTIIFFSSSFQNDRRWQLLTSAECSGSEHFCTKKVKSFKKKLLEVFSIQGFAPSTPITMLLNFCYQIFTIWNCRLPGYLSFYEGIKTVVSVFRYLCYFLSLWDKKLQIRELVCVPVRSTTHAIETNNITCQPVVLAINELSSNSVSLAILFFPFPLILI